METSEFEAPLKSHQSHWPPHPDLQKKTHPKQRGDLEVISCHMFLEIRYTYYCYILLHSDEYLSMDVCPFLANMISLL